MRGWMWLASSWMIACGAPAPALAPAGTGAASAGVAPAPGASFAIYTGELLDSCVDVRSTKDAAAARQTFDRLTKLPPDAKVTPLPSGCAAASDRVALASCEVVERDRDQVITSRYYLHETAFESETAMRQCMLHKGRWKAIAKESEAYLKAEDEALARGPSLGMKTGIPECDAYYKELMRCIQKLPEETREGVRGSLVDSFTVWQTPGQDPATVKAMCASALAAVTESPVCR